MCAAAGRIAAAARKGMENTSDIISGYSRAGRHGVDGLLQADRRGRLRVFDTGHMIRDASKLAIIGTAATVAVDAAWNGREEEEQRNFFGNLPPESAELIAASPILQTTMDKLLRDGWRIEFGELDKGIEGITDHDRKRIIINKDLKSEPQELVGHLAHEVGHASKGESVKIYPPKEGLTKEEWIKAALRNDFLDEADAQIFKFGVVREILANPGLAAPQALLGGTMQLLQYNYYTGGFYPHGIVPSREQLRHDIAETMFDGRWYDYYYPRRLEEWNDWESSR